MDTPSKRKVLTLKQKIDVINKSKSGVSSRKLAEEFNVGRTQIQNIVKRKSEFIDDFESNVGQDRKRRRHVTGNEEINSLCWDWFKDASSRRINITGPLIKEKALRFAKDLNKTEFKASNGWLESFKERHNIAFGTMSGERGDVNNVTVDEWKKNYQTFVLAIAHLTYSTWTKLGCFFGIRQIKLFE